MQEIIVYRNPLEAAFWNSMSNGGALIFLIVLMIGVFWVFVYLLTEKNARAFNKGMRDTYSICMWVSNLSTAALVAFLHFSYIG